MIDELILKSKQAYIQKYKDGEVIFAAGDSPVYYYQILKGAVKLKIVDSNGKEIIQESRHSGQSICGFTLFVDECYPVSAVASKDCEMIKMPRADFRALLDQHSELGNFLLEDISSELVPKYLLAGMYYKQNTADKIIILLDYLKRKKRNRALYSYKIPLTRREIADFTGLRVETVIRVIKDLEKQNLLRIINRKIFY
jgi:CRP-like cAMP-binding protein